MVDVTGKHIENGDLLIEIYNNGRRVFFHVAHNGFTNQYVRTVQCSFHSINSPLNLFKSQVKPKGCIVVSEEQFIRAIDNSINQNHLNVNDDYQIEMMKEKEQKCNLLLNFSREQKAKR